MDIIYYYILLYIIIYYCILLYIIIYYYILLFIIIYYYILLYINMIFFKLGGLRAGAAIPWAFSPRASSWWQSTGGTLAQQPDPGDDGSPMGPCPLTMTKCVEFTAAIVRADEVVRHHCVGVSQHLKWAIPRHAVCACHFKGPKNIQKLEWNSPDCY